MSDSFGPAVTTAVVYRRNSLAFWPEDLADSKSFTRAQCESVLRQIEENPLLKSYTVYTSPKSISWAVKQKRMNRWQMMIIFNITVRDFYIFWQGKYINNSSK